MQCNFCPSSARFSASHPHAPKPVLLCGADACATRLGLQPIGAPPKRSIDADEDAEPAQQPARAFDDLGTPEQLALASDVYTQLMALDRLVDMLGRQTVSRTGVTLPEGASAADRRTYEWRAEQLDSEVVKAFLLEAYKHLIELVNITRNLRTINAPLSGQATLEIARGLKALKRELRRLIQTYAANVANFTAADLRTLNDRLSAIAAAWRADRAVSSTEREVIDSATGMFALLPTELRVGIATDATTRRFPVYPVRTEPVSTVAVPYNVYPEYWMGPAMNDSGTLFVTERWDGTKYIVHQIHRDGRVESHPYVSHFQATRLMPLHNDPRYLVEVPSSGVGPRTLSFVKLQGGNGAARSTLITHDYGAAVFASSGSPLSVPVLADPPLGGGTWRTAFAGTLPRSATLYFIAASADNETGLYRRELEVPLHMGEFGGFPGHYPRSRTLIAPIPTLPSSGKADSDDHLRDIEDFADYVAVAVSDLPGNVGTGRGTGPARLARNRDTHFVAVSGLAVTRGPANDSYGVRVFTVAGEGAGGQILDQWDFTHVVPTGKQRNHQLAVDESGAVMIMHTTYDEDGDADKPQRFRATVYPRGGGSLTILDIELPPTLEGFSFLRVDAESVLGSKFLVFFVGFGGTNNAIWRFAI